MFGADNTPLAVALFCILLGIRFVNFEYCIGDSLLTLAAALAILVLGPSAAAVLPPLFLIPLHFVCFFSLLYITTQRPEMGNGGLYSFAYIYLTGNPVVGEALIRRGLLALTGYVLCGAILYAKHRHQHQEIRFHHVVRKFDLSKPVYLWQLRMALGVSLVMTPPGRFLAWNALCGWDLPALPCYRSILTPPTPSRGFGSGSSGRLRGPACFLFCTRCCQNPCIPCWDRWAGCAWDFAPTTDIKLP